MADLDKAYIEFLSGLKQRIATSRYEAARLVNTELLLLYWDIGNVILEKQADRGWGKKIIQQLAKDLSSAFPDMKGFSQRNLDYMRHFAKTWPDRPITQQLVAKLPWGHNIVLLQKLSNDSERLWYAQKTIENGWSRNVLLMQIESNLKKRLGPEDKTHNFDLALTKPQSDLANNTLKDP
jgi:predicted nuclease of restriction endonuclease-like (RecB) superfamily